MELLHPCKAPSVLTWIPRECWHACPCGYPHDSWMFTCVSLQAPTWCWAFTRVSTWAPKRCWVFTRMSPLGTHTAQPRVMPDWYICSWWGVFFSKHAFMLIIQTDTISYVLFHRIMMFPKFKVLSYVYWNHKVKNKSYMENNRSHA